MNLAVLGAGQLGVACSLALLTSKIRSDANSSFLLTNTSLVDVDHNSTITTRTVGNLRKNMFSVYKRENIVIPDVLHLSTYEKLCNDKCNVNGVIVCRPITEISTELQSITYRNIINRANNNFKEDSNTVPPFAIIFSSELDSSGNIPCDIWEMIYEKKEYNANNKSRSPSILVAGGPIFPAEWALQSSKFLESTLNVKTDAHNAINESMESKTCYEEETITTESSGTSLIFALHSQQLCKQDCVLEHEYASMLKELFPRETVHFLFSSDDAHSAEILSLIKCCQLLCSFGAGVVSNVFSECVTSALASYALQATVATQELINKLLSREASTPLPLSTLSIINYSCHSFNTNEFALGRNIAFYCHQEDAMNYTCQKSSHKVLTDSFDGIYMLMKRKEVNCPFYEMLIDAFNLIDNPAKIGIGLVQGRVCSSSNNRKESKSKIMNGLHNIFEAVFSGDEHSFQTAKDELANRFHATTTPLWQQTSEANSRRK